jgi:hypothetical protein
MHDAHDDEDDEDEDEGDEEGSSHAMDEDYDERGGGSAGSTPGGGARSVRFSEDAAAAGGTRTPDDAAQGSTPGFVGSSLKTEVKLEEEATPSGDEHHLRTMDNEPLADILAPQGGEEGYGDGADDMKMDHDGNDDDPFAPGAERALAMAQVPEFTMGGVKDDDESKGLEGAAEDDGFFASAVELDDGGAAFADAAAPMGEAGTPLTFPPMTHLDEELGVEDGLAGFEQPLLQFDGTFLSPSTENKILILSQNTRNYPASSRQPISTARSPRSATWRRAKAARTRTARRRRSACWTAWRRISTPPQRRT